MAANRWTPPAELTVRDRPAANPWSLPAELTDRIAALATDLADAVAELRAAHDEKSERWQDGDKDTSVETWIEAIDEVVVTLENLETSCP